MRTHILCQIIFSPRKSCHLWDKVEKYGRAKHSTNDNIIRRMRFACWITKATDTHSEYLILMTFPQQQWLRERVSMLRYSTLPVSFINACYHAHGYSPPPHFRVFELDHEMLWVKGRLKSNFTRFNETREIFEKSCGKTETEQELTLSVMREAKLIFQ
jgi:hypothetical protein